MARKRGPKGRSTRAGSTQHSNKKKPRGFVCPNCGKLVRGRNHLCSVEEPDLDLAHCMFRGQPAQRYAGAPPEDMRYACMSCGRLTPFRDGVCDPEPIEGPPDIQDL